MTILTDTPELEVSRRTILTMLAREYPAQAPRQFPDKPFHRWLARYGVVASGEGDPGKRDDSHRYIRVDMSRCIYCCRCVRICEEVQGQFVWSMRNRAERTSIVADGGVPLGESSCVSCGACVDTCPTGALEDRFPEGSPPKSWVRTVCPYCGTGCEMDAGVSEGRLVAVKPAREAVVNRGHLCVKGRYAFGYVHAEDRVTEPHVRRHGEWTAVSWQEALHVAAGGLRRILAEFGPDALGVLGSARATNEENYLTQKFARLVLGTNNVDCCARVCHAPTAHAMGTMLGTGAATNSFDDIELARTILLFGANPTENHPIVGARIKQAALAGAKLIVADPRQIELAAYATVHLPVQPGTNVPLLNAMASTIVEENLEDAAFLNDRVADGDSFRRFVREWTPERAAAICGVPAEKIRQAARLYAGTKPSIIIHGLGVTENIQGSEGVMCLVNLALLTGNLGKRGAGINPLRGQNNVQGAAHMGCEPSRLAGYVGLADGHERFERFWGGTIPRSTGKHLLQMMDAAERGELRGLWAIGYDILLTNPNATVTRRALSKLDLLIVQDIFWNETAREFATVFLPAATSFEKDGTFMNAERRVQRVRKVIDVVGNSRPDWQIVCDMARAMDHQQGFAFGSAEEIWNEVRAIWGAGAGISYSRLDQQGLQWPCPTEVHPGTEMLHETRFASGEKVALRLIRWIESTESSYDAAFPLLLITGRTLYQFNAGTMTMRTPNVHWRSRDALDVSVEDARAYGLGENDRVRVVSRHGETELNVHITDSIPRGRVFSTFHSAEEMVNLVVGPGRDPHTGTPEYKVTSVRLEKAG